MKMNERPEFIVLDKISYSVQQGHDSRTVLDEISVVWRQPCAIALQGISGSGKSTLLSIIAGLLHPTSGSIAFGNHYLTANTTELWNELRSKYLGYVFQAPLLISELSVIENVMLRGLLHNIRPSDLYEEAYVLLQQLGIHELADVKPTLLSGGEQQRVSLARALLHKPPFILMDEPTAHLDAQTRTRFIELITTIRRQQQLGIIIATHDPTISATMDEVWGLENGKLIKMNSA